jgi:hypothetical protein
MRPILLPSASTNHMAPSGPEMMLVGSNTGVGSGKRVIVPLGVTLLMLLSKASVYHKLLSSPTVILHGAL